MSDEDKLADIEAQVEILTTQIHEKYSELLAISSMSPKEFNELYPTSEDRIELAKRAQKAQAEFMQSLRPLFLQLPADVREDNLLAAREYFVKNLGTEAADMIMTELRAHLKL